MKAEKGIKLIALLKAKSGYTRDQFAKRWVEDHTPLLLKWKNLKGYRVNVFTKAYQEMEVLPYDGTAELWWDSLAAMQEDFASADAKTAAEDADEFTIIRQHIYTEEFIIK
jgi:uncharacterized protein (TIGR02118 family)